VSRFNQTLKLSDAIQSILRDGLDLSQKHGRSDLMFDRAAGAFEVRAKQNHYRQDVILEAIDDARGAIEQASHIMESPIERNILPFLIFGPYKDFNCLTAEVHTKDQEALPEAPIVIVPQFAFVRFRLDFAVVARLGGHTRIVAVECDGEDYHNGHENCMRDWKRDRYLASWNIETIRISGKQIHQDPEQARYGVIDKMGAWAFDAKQDALASGGESS
jgi:hypothetical protein